MIVGANSMPTLVPNLQGSEEGNFMQCKQFNLKKSNDSGKPLCEYNI